MLSHLRNKPIHVHHPLGLNLFYQRLYSDERSGPSDTSAGKRKCPFVNSQPLCSLYPLEIGHNRFVVVVVVVVVVMLEQLLHMFQELTPKRSRVCGTEGPEMKAVKMMYSGTS